MNLFKELCLKIAFKYSKERNVENKKTNGIAVASGPNSNVTIYNYALDNNFDSKKITVQQEKIVSDMQKSIEKNVKDNLTLIMNSEIDDKLFDSVKNLEHFEQIKNFVESGIKSDSETANFISSLLPDMFKSENFRKRKDIENAIEFLKESNSEEKSILVWAFYHHIFLGNILYLGSSLILKNLREKYPLPNKISRENTMIFNKFWINVSGVFATSRITTSISNDEKIKYFFGNKDNLYKLIPELKIYEEGNLENCLSTFFNKPLNIASITLLKEAGLKFD